MSQIDHGKPQPNFLIIGAQKAGTTSLYSYLTQHPQIVAATTKEIHFFDLYFHKGIDWYQDQFAAVTKNLPQKNENNIPATEENGNQGLITGEASPYYIFHPLVPQRVYQFFTQIKLILLLRNPVDRAISHYYHEVRLGSEYLSLEQAFMEEEFRLKGELEKITYNPSYYSFNHQHYTYLSRSRYIEQLTLWMKFFPRKQFLILKSEDFYNQPDAIVNQVFKFLNLPPYQLAEYNKLNEGDYPKTDPTTYRKLDSYFQPYNQKLAEYCGINFHW